MQAYADQEINGLRRVRELLVRTGQPGAVTARLLLFSSTQPSAQLRNLAEDGNVQLIGLDDLFE